jgi:hypothetical protein
MKILIIHHVEPQWVKSFNRDENDYLLDIENHVIHNDYDRIIMTTLEGDGYQFLEEICHQHEEWSYAWDNPETESEWYDDCNIDTEDIISSSGHEYTYLYPWIKNLAGHEITILGGADGECLEDLRCALNHLEIEFDEVRELIY